MASSRSIVMEVVVSVDGSRAQTIEFEEELSKVFTDNDVDGEEVVEAFDNTETLLDVIGKEKAMEHFGLVEPEEDEDA